MANKINRVKTSHKASKREKIQDSLWNSWLYQRIKIIVNLYLTGFVGIISPSFLNITYLLLFIIVCTLWASGFKFTSINLYYIRVFLLTYNGMHIILLYITQLEIFQKLYPDGQLIVRLLGLYYNVNTSCELKGKAIFITQRIIDYFNPFALALLFYIYSLDSKIWIDKDTIHNLASIKKFSNRNFVISNSESHNSSIDINTGVTLKNIKRPLLSSIVNAFIRNSYILTFIAMMVWSVTYKSWLTFILLLLASILWLIPDSRKACLYMSPVIVGYGIILIILNYISNINAEEIYNLVSSSFYGDLNELGLFRWDIPLISLSFTIGYLVIFWLTLRLFSKERKKVVPNSYRNPNLTKFKDDLLFRRFVDFIQTICAKYWIFVCCIILITMSIQKKVKACYIIYIILMTYFIAVFMFSYSFWRKQMYIFWWIVVIYSLTLLFGIYSYQFNIFRNIWNTYTIFTERMLNDFGFEFYSSSTLFEGLLIPMVFLVVTIIQVHYVHQPFMDISELTKKNPEVRENDVYLKTLPINKSSSELSGYSHNFVISSIILLFEKWRHNANTQDNFVVELNYFVNDVNSAFNVLSRNLTKLFNNIYLKIWRLLEVHFTKVVVLCIIIYSINNVNAFNIILVMLVVFFYPFQNLHGLLIFVTFILLSIQLIFTMAFQLSSVDYVQWQSNCSNLKDNADKPYPEDMDNLKSIGLIKHDDFRKNSQFSVFNLLLCCMWYVIKYHQIRHFKLSKHHRPEKSIIFPEFSYSHLNDTLLSFLKFFLNFAFYKVGLELCYIMTVINAYLRVDVMSIAYLLLLFVFLPSSRLFCSKIWMLYLIILTILIPFQYFICFGFVPLYCQDYPITFIYIKKWIFYPHKDDELNVHKLTGDMLQLLFVISQHHVFLIEKSTANYKGGDNRPILANEIPNTNEKDFITHNESYTGYLKLIIFYWFYWLCLAVIFLNGIMRNTVFCFGYMILATIYFWIGQRIMLKKRKYLLSMWNIILFYNFFIILIKCLLKILGCTVMQYVPKHSYCWIIQLIGIECSDILKCKTETSILIWDVICFVLLILQRKIFISKLFCFVVLHLKIQNKFTSRGAQLISKKLIAILKDEKHKEDLVFGKIQKKILKIEQTHQNYGKPLPNEHYLVLRSGDYFLFDGNPEDEDDDYVEGELETESSTPLDSTKETGLNLIQNKPNISRMLRSNENKIDSVCNRQYNATLEKEGKSDYTGIGEIGFLKKRSNAAKQDNLSNENSKIKKGFFVINPQRLSTTSDESYYTPMTTNDDFKIRHSVQLSEKAEDNRLRRIERSDNFRAPLTSTLRKKQTLSDLINARKVNKYGFWSKSKAVCAKCYAFFLKCLISVIKWINKLTQNSRKVGLILDNEKQIIKKKIISYAEGDWFGKQSNEFFVLTSQGQTLGIDYIMEAYNTSTADIFKRTYRVVELLSINVEIFENQYVFDENENNFSKVNPEHSIVEENIIKRSKFFLLIIAVANLLIIYSEFLCYIILICNHIISFNIISLIYPLSVFLWAMLSVPRPSTFYWMFIILYTQLAIVTKYIFKFNFIDFYSGASASEKSSPFFLPVIIGIDNSKNYAIVDLIQLLVLFLHRGYLKDNGLWKGFKETSSHEVDINDEEIKLKRNRVLIILLWPFTELKRFYINLVTYRYSKRVDFYVYMFIFEFISFFIIVLGYKTFGSAVGSSSSALDFIKENKIPVQFILMLITQFIFIIIDRALFLRKQVTGKLFFLIFHVILIHAWIFFLNPYISQSKFNAYYAPQMLYCTKCLYFALSAYQIKSGYPLRILGNFLTKRHNYVNLFLFKAYMVVPFLYELRNVMDWIWTDTSVSLYHWMEIEDVFTKVFVIKCWRRAELEYPTHRGNNRWYVSKILVGGCLLSFFFICLWGPLTVGTIIGATFVKNPPIKCSSSLDVDGFAYIYHFTSRNQYLRTLEYPTYNQMKKCYQNNLESLHYFKSFEASDITALELGPFSESSWMIPPPSLNLFLKILLDKSLKPKINYIVTCERLPKDTINTNIIVSATYTRELTAQERVNLRNVLLFATPSLTLVNIIPKYIVAKKRSMDFIPDEIYLDDNRFLSVNIRLISENDLKWWNIMASNLSNCTQELGPQFLTVYLLSERISDSLFGQLFARYGIMGMYAAYILVAHRLMRAIYADISYIIRCEELPYVDRIIAILNEIYLVRENKMFRLEEQLVAKLIFLYRSSETMIKWTRHKQSTLHQHMD